MSTRVADPASTPTAQPAPGGRLGLALLLALLTAGTAVLLGAGFWISASGDAGDGAFVLIAVHATAGVLALGLALSPGQLEVHRPSDPADGPRPRWVALRVWACITGALAAVATGGALITGVPAWIAVGLLAGLVGMAGASWLIGHRTRIGAEARAAGAGADPIPGLDWTPAVIRRKILTIVSVGLLAAVAVTVVLLLFLDEARRQPGRGVAGDRPAGGRGRRGHDHGGRAPAERGDGVDPARPERRRAQAGGTPHVGQGGTALAAARAAGGAARRGLPHLAALPAGVVIAHRRRVGDHPPPGRPRRRLRHRRDRPRRRLPRVPPLHRDRRPAPQPLRRVDARAGPVGPAFGDRYGRGMSGRGTDQRSTPTTDAAQPGGLGGRIALLLVLVALILGLATLYGFGLYQSAVVSDVDAAAVLPQLIAGLLALAFAPALGLLEPQSWRDPERTAGTGRRPVRVIVWVGITALAVVVHAVASLVGGVSPLVVLGFAVAAVATAATSWILVVRAQAAAVRRLGARLADDTPTLSIDLDWTEDTARRKWRLIGLVFVVALVVSLGGTLILDRFEPQDTAQAAALVLQFSLLAPALTCLFVSIGAQLSGSAITGALAKEHRKAVAQRAQGKGVELEPGSSGAPPASPSTAARCSPSSWGSRCCWWSRSSSPPSSAATPTAGSSSSSSPASSSWSARCRSRSFSTAACRGTPRPSAICRACTRLRPPEPTRLR
ncbi:hypothetical protein [Clavibacter tessellarius]|uniref:hypothetical protein n=1 Tax=Clavibacter tessellarius TaxID=31965 RepID=UPI003243941C